ncbi:MAG: type II toxin-antitoxin system VapC family toxin [Chloroflexota bacterium]
MSAGLLDTSVVIDWNDADVLSALPDDASVCAITVAELAAGPHLASSRAEAASRQARLQQVEALFEPLPFDTAAARAYGQMVAAVVENGRSHRRRVGDLLIAAIAQANGLPLYTRNPGDFAGLTGLIEIIKV